MTRPRVGILDLSMPGWTAGRAYSEVVLRSLLEAGAQERAELLRVTQLDEAGDSLNHLPVRPLRYAPTPAAEVERALTSRLPGALGRHPQAARAGRALGRAAGALRGGSPLLRAGARGQLSLLFPLLELLHPAPFATVGWIPDFQHVYQPSFFSADERSWRDFSFKKLSELSTRLLLSSQAARDHFARFAPGHASKAAVAPFPSLLCFEAMPARRGEALAKFRIPPKFALVINQIWAHKNPEVVVDAVALAREQGVVVPLVMIGMPSDYRDPENKTVSRLLQRVAERGLGGQVQILGKVSFAELLDLLRAAAVLIQPSRFEGWSTSVQDAKALGRPLLCSDLPVHREQAPSALGFFGCDEPGALARLLVERFEGLAPGGDADLEAASLAAQRRFAREFGQRLLDLFLSTIDSFSLATARSR